MSDKTRTPTVVVDTSQSRHTRLRPVPLTAVTLTDAFWAPRRRINRDITLLSQYRRCEDTGRIDNFRRAAGKKAAPFRGRYYNDSDVYKWLEAAAWTLATDADPALAQMVDTVITEITAAQQPDGYLNTHFMLDRAGERWTNLRDMHELYCAGHLIQAAVAHHRATGSDRLLGVARRLADHICDIFGPEEAGKRPGTGGHEEIEMALVELARTTGAPRYQRQAQYFLDVRGEGLIGGRAYHQDHRPFREFDRMAGHAVRAVYLNAGAADLYAETGETALREALERLWRTMTTRQLYLSGGIGSRHAGEAFGQDYELPNARAYAETCAAIGSVMWNWRMLALDGNARYADLMELTLYNGFLVGLSLDGERYFYENSLASDGTHRRQPWFECACCPPNIARMLASLPGYFYSVSNSVSGEGEPGSGGVWVHLYAENTARFSLPDGRIIGLTQRTRYPWDGDVVIEIDGEGTFSLWLRIPAWCGAGAALDVNGQSFTGALVPGTYAEVRRTWQPGDTVRLRLPMPVRCVEAHPYALENADRVALMRGPLLYCVEQADNPDLDPRDVVLPAGVVEGIADQGAASDFRPDLLGGVVVLSAQAEVVPPDEAWAGHLYRAARPRVERTREQRVEVTAIPYYAWANREAGAMQVWLRHPLYLGT
ncbi:MAG: Non-reducing end beta-L-arabinofuranosidase [Anaerolineales bacterium]|nr:Non-reducing end beta-L-arabinofuranosidase [Anaerolineales bacterium]